MISSAGIDPELLRNPESFLTFKQLGTLLRICVQATGCEHFGLLVGQRSSIANFGLVGRLMQSAPTLGVALRDFCANQKYYIRGAVAYLAVQDDTAFWGYAVYFPDMEAREQLTDGALAAGVRLFRELTGNSPDAVLASRRTPAGKEPYRRFYKVTPQFEAEQDAMVFPARLLQAPILGSNANLRPSLEEEVARLWANRKLRVSDEIVRILRAGVIFDRDTLKDVAYDLRLHPRTVNRRLKDEGSSFRDLANTARFQVACQLLSATRMPVTDIALALGYADASAFARAFRRSAGTAPSDWREQA